MGEVIRDMYYFLEAFIVHYTRAIIYAWGSFIASESVVRVIYLILTRYIDMMMLGLGCFSCGVKGVSFLVVT